MSARRAVAWKPWLVMIIPGVGAFFGVAAPITALALSGGDRFWVPRPEFAEFRLEVREWFHDLKQEINATSCSTPQEPQIHSPRGAKR